MNSSLIGAWGSRIGQAKLSTTSNFLLWTVLCTMAIVSNPHFKFFGKAGVILMLWTILLIIQILQNFSC
jgi:hypothetical protein